MAATTIRGWSALGATVGLEILATLCLRFSEGFTIFWASAVAITAYAATVVTLSVALTTIPMSVAYVIWTGVGTTGVVGLNVVLFDEVLSAAAWWGVALVVVGVIMINARPTKPDKESGGTAQEHSQ